MNDHASQERQALIVEANEKRVFAWAFVISAFLLSIVLGFAFGMIVAQ